MGRLKERLKIDPVYRKASAYFENVPQWHPEMGYGQSGTMEYQAHTYCRAHVKEFDNGYRAPSSGYWGKFKQAFFVMEAEHVELARMANDKKSLSALAKLQSFAVTQEISMSYQYLAEEHAEQTGDKKRAMQLNELLAIANQEQVNVLQPLIYDDPHLKKTMDVNHRFSRLTDGWLSPKFKVIYSAAAQNLDPELETVFDAPSSLKERLTGERQSLPDMQDWMQFVRKIAKQFDHLMATRRDYMDSELKKILRWVSA